MLLLIKLINIILYEDSDNILTTIQPHSYHYYYKFIQDVHYSQITTIVTIFTTSVTIFNKILIGLMFIKLLPS